MHLIRNEDKAGSIPAASSRRQERLYDECNDDAGIGAQRELRAREYHARSSCPRVAHQGCRSHRGSARPLCTRRTAIALRHSLAAVSALAVADPDAVEEEHPHPRRTQLPVLRREAFEQRIGAGACGSARSRRAEHMGEPGRCMSRLQRMEGRQDASGSRHEAASPAAPNDDSHLSRFHAPDGSRRGEVEEVSVLLIFSRPSSRPERRLGIAKDVG